MGSVRNLAGLGKKEQIREVTETGHQSLERYFRHSAQMLDSQKC